MRKNIIRKSKIALNLLKIRFKNTLFISKKKIPNVKEKSGKEIRSHKYIKKIVKLAFFKKKKSVCDKSCNPAFENLLRNVLHFVQMFPFIIMHRKMALVLFDLTESYSLLFLLIKKK